MKRALLAAACAAAILAGCGGGGGAAPPTTPTGAPGVPLPGNPKGTASVSASAAVSLDRIPASLRRSDSRVRRSAASLHTRALSIVSVQVNGTLYQGAASATTVTNTQNVTPVNNAVTVSMTFSNAVPADNDWITFDFYAVAGDGSKSYLGTLATLIDITSAGTTVNLDDKSTRRLQVALAMLQRGLLSSWDVENTAALDANLGTAIGNAAFDAQTELFDPAQVQTLAEQIAPAYERDIVLSADSAAFFTVVYDYTRPDENDLAFNVQSTYLVQPNGPQLPAATVGSGTYAVGAPFTPAGSPALIPVLHGPSSGFNHATPGLLNAAKFDQAGQTVTIRNVYGGALITGAKQVIINANGTESIPAHGSNGTLAGRAPGSVSQALSTASPTQAAVQVNDPQLLAFYPTPNNISILTDITFSAVRPVNPLPLTNSGGSVPTYTGGVIFGETFQSPYLLVDYWNPYALPPSSMQICGFVTCSPLTTSGPVDLRMPFLDPASNLAYYNWAGSGAPGDGTTGVTQVSGSFFTGPKAYQVSSSTASGSIVSTTPAVFPAHAVVTIASNTAPGTLWTVTVTANGVDYTARGINSGINATTTLSSLPQTVTSSKIVFTYQLASGSPDPFLLYGMAAAAP